GRVHGLRRRRGDGAVVLGDLPRLRPGRARGLLRHHEPRLHPSEVGRCRPRHLPLRLGLPGRDVLAVPARSLMSQPLTAAVCAAAGVPVGWLAGRAAQQFIERRTLEKGDTEIRLPAATAVALNVLIFGALGWRFAPGPTSILAVYLVIFTFL